MLNGSANTVAASAKDTPCFARFDSALVESHSKSPGRHITSEYGLYPMNVKIWPWLGSIRLTATPSNSQPQPTTPAESGSKAHGDQGHTRLQPLSRTVWPRVARDRKVGCCHTWMASEPHDNPHRPLEVPYERRNLLTAENDGHPSFLSWKTMYRRPTTSRAPGTTQRSVRLLPPSRSRP